MKLMTAILMIAVFATGAWAQQTVTFGWEDGVSTVLSTYYNVDEVFNDGAMANSGTHSLYANESSLTGTGELYLAVITNLNNGDEVTASFYGYDDTPGVSPSLRIWGGYCDTDGIDSYTGSAGGNSTYTAGTGWEQIAYTFVFDDSEGHDALIIKARLYSAAVGDDFWVDDLEVTAPENAIITLPNELPVSTENAAFGAVKALYR